MALFAKSLRYQMKIFAVACICIWTVIAIFAVMQYRQEKALRQSNIINRHAVAVGGILDYYANNRDVQPFMSFLSRYYRGTVLDGMRIGVFNTSTGELLYSTGEIPESVPRDIDEAERWTFHDGSRVLRMIHPEMDPPTHPDMFLYSSRISPDGAIEVITFLPMSEYIREGMSIGPFFWWIILIVGAAGTLLVYIISAHQARTISLLRDFAMRAAEDRDFIPLGNFPADELGDISRQVVAIYNSRVQASKRRDQEHQVAQAAMEERNRMKRVLTNNVSHELKTPLGIIRPLIDMMVNQDDMTDDDRKHFLKIVQGNVERMVVMLNDLSTMTRLEEGSANVRMEMLDFYKLVESIAEQIEVTRGIRDMKFEYSLPEPCMVWGNGALINSVLMNLIRNAKAYSKGTVMGISLLGSNAAYYTFVFYDNGTGVGAEHLPHLFDRFYRVDSGRSRKAGGTGLGLPIVKSSLKAMNGTVSVRNRNGGGLEFIFTLPRLSIDEFRAQRDEKG